MVPDSDPPTTFFRNDASVEKFLERIAKPSHLFAPLLRKTYSIIHDSKVQIELLKVQELSIYIHLDLVQFEQAEPDSGCSS